MYVFLIILSSFFARSAENVPNLIINCDETCRPVKSEKLNRHYIMQHYAQISDFYEKHTKNSDGKLTCYMNKGNTTTIFHTCRKCMKIRFFNGSNRVCRTCQEKKSKKDLKTELTCFWCSKMLESSWDFHKHIEAEHPKELQDSYPKKIETKISKDGISSKICEIGHKRVKVNHCDLCDKFFLSSPSRHSKKCMKQPGNRYKSVSVPEVIDSERSQTIKDDVITPFGPTEFTNKMSIASLLN